MAASFPLRARLSPLSPRPLLGACLFVILWAGAMRLLATGTVPGHPVDRPEAVLAGSATGAACVILITRLLAWRGVQARTGLQWMGLYLATMVPSTVAMVAVFILMGLPGAGGAAFLIVPVATWGTAMGLAWVFEEYVFRLRASARVRDRLSSLVMDTAEFDALLAQARTSTSAAKAEVIARNVQEPLSSLRERAPTLDDLEYALELDGLVAGTMRPLAHLLHPVTVRAGLVPALRSLGSRIEIEVSEEVVDADAAGVLLDPGVRMQAYRWARGLTGTSGAAHLAIWAQDGRLHLEARDASLPGDLDPIQLIAGLASHSASHISAPLHGTPVSPVTPDGSRARRLALIRVNWRRLLTPSPVISPGIVALVCLITAPALSFINSVNVTPAVLLALAIAVLLPTALAYACRHIRVRRDTTRGAVSALAVWAGVGLASALAQIIVLNTFSVMPMTRTLIITLIVRGLARLLVPGVLWMSVQSLSRINEEDAAELQVRLDALQLTRRQTLVQADLRDQEVSEILHRTIQGRLSAAALMLRMDRRAEADAVVAQIVDVTLPALLSSLHPAPPTTGTGVTAGTGVTTPTEAKGGWGALDASGLAVTDTVDWDDLSSRSVLLGRDLHRSIAENLANAVRHGHATLATVSASRTGSHLTISCHDNGAGPQPDFVPGLGSRIHDEVAATYGGQWSLTRVASQTVFTMSVRVPGDAADSTGGGG